METLESLLTHVHVFWDVKARRYHWLYGNGDTYCGHWKSTWVRKTLAELPKSRACCKDCRHAAALIKEGRFPSRSNTTPEN